eukprot:COSAG02_NODE_142_length_34188_cov_183.180791_11_plen_147_part_00
MDINDDSLNCGRGETVNNYFVAGGGSYFMCEPCEAGKKMELTSHREACSECGFGQYSSSGADACVNCESGQYAEYRGSTSCISCPSGQTSGPGAGVCTSSDDDNYDDDSGASVDDQSITLATKASSSARGAIAVLFVMALGFGATV